MKKYLQIFKISWSDSLVYRLNFIMWRIRSIFWFITVYFFWFAVFTQNDQVANYDRSLMFTYVIGSALLRSLILGFRSSAIGAEIATGDLNNYLIKPVNYFTSWFTRDLADKILNLVFFTLELTLIILIIKPPLVFPNNPLHLLFFILAVLLAILMYFFFSFLISAFTFWYPEHNGWPLRFFMLTIIGFLAGSGIPLDIFPQVIFNIFKFLPFSYFTFFPLQIFLGRLEPNQITFTFSIMIIWSIIFYKLSRIVWKKGLKIYGAYGR